MYTLNIYKRLSRRETSSQTVCRVMLFGVPIYQEYIGNRLIGKICPSSNDVSHPDWMSMIARSKLSLISTRWHPHDVAKNFFWLLPSPPLPRPPIDLFARSIATARNSSGAGILRDAAQPDVTEGYWKSLRNKLIFIRWNVSRRNCFRSGSPTCENLRCLHIGPLKTVGRLCSEYVENHRDYFNCI